VRGVSVCYGTTTRHTNTHGQVTVTVAEHTGKGTRAITYTDTGYAGGTLHVRIT
jgi:hypothetical protein